MHPVAQNDLKEQIEWFQKTHEDGYYDKKNGNRVFVNNHSNDAAIKGFEKNLYSQYNIKRLKLTEDEIKDVIVHLRKLYH